MAQDHYSKSIQTVLECLVPHCLVHKWTKHKDTKTIQTIFKCLIIDFMVYKWTKHNHIKIIQTISKCVTIDCIVYKWTKHKNNISRYKSNNFNNLKVIRIYGKVGNNRISTERNEN